MTTNMIYARLRGKSHGPNSERLLPNLPNSTTAAKMAAEDIIQGSVGDCCLEDKSGTPRFTPQKFNIDTKNGHVKKEPPFPNHHFGYPYWFSRVYMDEFHLDIGSLSPQAQ